MWPDLRHVEDIPTVVLSLRRTHHVNKNVPLRKFLSFDGLIHIPNHIVGILSCDPSCLFMCKVLHPLARLDVNLGVVEGAVLGIIDQYEPFIAVAISLPL